jgi:ankyrin repeat protein
MFVKNNSIFKGGSKDSGRKNFLKVITVLVKFNADVNAVGSERMTAIHLAGVYSNAEMAKWVLERKADPNFRAKTLRLETPLMVAARYGSVAVMAQLMLFHADIELVDVSFSHSMMSRLIIVLQMDGNSALHYAALYGQTEAALFLLRVGAIKNMKNKVRKKRFYKSIDIYLLFLFIGRRGKSQLSVR